MKEQWADVPGYEGYYRVSNLGRIQSIRRAVPIMSKTKIIPERIMRQNIVSGGYAALTLCKKGTTKRFYFHRLVWIAFVGSIPTGVEIDHKNHDKLDNKLSNLRTVTHVRNQANLPKMRSRRGRALSSKHKGVSYITSQNRWCAQIRHNGNSVLREWFLTEEEARKACEAKRRELRLS